MRLCICFGESCKTKAILMILEEGSMIPFVQRLASSSSYIGPS